MPVLRKWEGVVINLKVLTDVNTHREDDSFLANSFRNCLAAVINLETQIKSIPRKEINNFKMWSDVEQLDKTAEALIIIFRDLLSEAREHVRRLESPKRNGSRRLGQSKRI